MVYNAVQTPADQKNQLMNDYDIVTATNYNPILSISQSDMNISRSQQQTFDQQPLGDITNFQSKKLVELQEALQKQSQNTDELDLFAEQLDQERESSADQYLSRNFHNQCGPGLQQAQVDSSQRCQNPTSFSNLNHLHMQNSNDQANNFKYSNGSLK